MTVGPEENDIEAKESDGRSHNSEHDAFEKATLATAIIGVVILIVYTILTGYQAYIAKDTAQRQLRAYISAVVEKWPDLDKAEPAEITMVFKNVGQTPAFKVNAKFSIFTTHDQPTETQIEELRVTPNLRSESILFPTQEFRLATVPGKGIPITPQQRISVSMGAMILWIDGQVTYLDAYGYSRFYRFRLYMGGSAGAASYHRFVWADAGNEAN
jgi:hypothetical protein